MVFWDTLPLWNYLQTKSMHFICKKFTREHLQSPTGTSYTVATHKDITTIREFIKMYFGNPPYTPVTNIPEDFLLCNDDHILYINDASGVIAGCIRYHYIGQFIGDIPTRKIYSIDCFCIRPEWRKRGLGAYLLTALHNYVNSKGIPYSLFLKEGVSISLLYRPFYSGIYAYKSTKWQESTNVKKLMPLHAFRLIDIFYKSFPTMFIIRNIYNKNQIWRLYSNGSNKILACFQDCFQEKNGKKMAICTGWLETPCFNTKIRETAVNNLIDSLNPQFGYVWVNREWVKDLADWTLDGPFHWYLYQWSTSHTLYNGCHSYCLPI